MSKEAINESEEMYLKTLFEQQLLNPVSPVRTSDVSNSLNISAASATEMIQRLAAKGFVEYVPYKGAKLSDTGMSIASQIKRRESLMELFLIRLIGYKGNVKEAACRLEHALTEELEKAIDRLLGFPEFDHSGGEIPHVLRELDFMDRNQLLPLRVLKNGEKGKIELIILSGQEIRTVGELGIDIGVEIECKDGIYFVGKEILKISDLLTSRIVIRRI